MARQDWREGGKDWGECYCEQRHVMAESGCWMSLWNNQDWHLRWYAAGKGNLPPRAASFSNLILLVNKYCAKTHHRRILQDTSSTPQQVQYESFNKTIMRQIYERVQKNMCLVWSDVKTPLIYNTWYANVPHHWEIWIVDVFIFKTRVFLDWNRTGNAWKPYGYTFKLGTARWRSW